MDEFASKFDSTVDSTATADVDPFGGLTKTVDVSGGFGGENFQNDSMDFLSEIIPATQVSFRPRNIHYSGNTLYALGKCTLL